MQRKFQLFSLSLALIVAACSASETTMSTNDSAPSSTDKGTEAPGFRYRQKPQSKQAYRVTMTLADAPGPFKIMASAVQYDVVNKECLPPPNVNPGGYTSPVPTNDIPFELTKVSDNEYAGAVYADGMIDEDYHGRGVCRWELMQAQVQLKATGADGETQFIASLSREPLFTQQALTIHYWKGDYPSDAKTTLDNPVNFGQSDRSRMASHLADDDLFTITLTSEEIRP